MRRLITALQAFVAVLRLGPDRTLLMGFPTASACKEFQRALKVEGVPDCGIGGPEGN